MPMQDVLKTHHSTAIFFEMAHQLLKSNTLWKADCETNGVFFKHLPCSLNQVLSIRSLSKKPLLLNHSVHSWGWLHTGGKKVAVASASTRTSTRTSSSLYLALLAFTKLFLAIWPNTGYVVNPPLN